MSHGPNASTTASVTTKPSPIAATGRTSTALLLPVSGIGQGSASCRRWQ
jgi:hypothetical protein